MTTIAVDGLNEEAFRRSIENRLRCGKAADAIAKLRALLAPYAGPGGILPERFLTVKASDLSLFGWDGLHDAIARHETPDRPITALSISFGWPGEDLPVPDADGRLSPLVETAYFTDEAFPFSQSARDDLLDGYSYHGCTWSDQSTASDGALSLAGIDDLHGALAALEARLLASDEPDEEEIRAGSLGACLLSALLFQAVSERIERDGLPRPLCVLAGSNGVYPYFDAPVAGIPKAVLKAAEAAEEEEIPAGQGVPGPRYSSLLVTGIPRARKRAVLVLEESSEEAAVRTAKLRGLDPEDSSVPPLAKPVPELSALPVPDGITPVPNGPLMAKKKPSESWDFRDLLSPRDPEAPAAEPTPREIDGGLPDGFPSPTDRFEDAAPSVEGGDSAPPILPGSTVATPVEPGFSLLEPTVQERLQSLIMPPLALDQPRLVPIERVPSEPEPLAVDEAPALGPVWPLGIGWLEDAEPVAAEPLELSIEASLPGPGLWARLRAWVRRRS